MSMRHLTQVQEIRITDDMRMDLVIDGWHGQVQECRDATEVA